MEPEKQFNESKICLKFGDDVTQTNGLKANFNLHLVSDKVNLHLSSAKKYSFQYWRIFGTGSSIKLNSG